MANPLKGLIPQQNVNQQREQVPPQMVQSFQKMAENLAMVQDPQKKQTVLQQLANNNPMMQNVLQLVNGKNPQQVFLDKCKELGVDSVQFAAQFGIKL